MALSTEAAGGKHPPSQYFCVFLRSILVSKSAFSASNLCEIFRPILKFCIAILLSRVASIVYNFAIISSLTSIADVNNGTMGKKILANLHSRSWL